MFVWKLCFGFSGRINRAIYWLGIVIAFWIVLLGMMSFRLMPSVSASLIIALALLPLYLVIALAVAVKRLHDLDISGWWAIGFLIAWYLTVGVFELAQKPSIGAAISALLFAGVIWLGSAEGQEGENRFGPEPIARTGKRLEAIGLSKAAHGNAADASRIGMFNSRCETRSSAISHCSAFAFSRLTSSRTSARSGTNSAL
jgi:uncharacterized membrane protein YhaH (DUF805 family)